MTAVNDFNHPLIEEFRANDGKVGGDFAGAPLLLLTTTGAKTGRPHTTPVVYLDDGRRREARLRVRVEGRRADQPGLVPQPRRQPDRHGRAARRDLRSARRRRRGRRARAGLDGAEGARCPASPTTSRRPRARSRWSRSSGSRRRSPRATIVRRSQNGQVAFDRAVRGLPRGARPIGTDRWTSTTTRCGFGSWRSCSRRRSPRSARSASSSRSSVGTGCGSCCVVGAVVFAGLCVLARPLLPSRGERHAAPRTSPRCSRSSRSSLHHGVERRRTRRSRCSSSATAAPT